jgi:DNA gyrase subunit B
LLEKAIGSHAEAVKVLKAKAGKTDAFEIEVARDSKESVSIKAVHIRTGLARNHTIPAELFSSEAFGRLAEVHGQMLKNLGRPPFRVTLGERAEEAHGFVDIHGAVLDLAKHGIQLTRFKGLGEMNADQLRETTMDPATRTLQRVTLEDATAADQIFSMLMGDQVAPRRDFIETYAREADNLDV